MSLHLVPLQTLKRTGLTIALEWRRHGFPEKAAPSPRRNIRSVKQSRRNLML
jgi:hypothetical protein